MLALGVFTDEISDDFDHALDVAAELGISNLQLRTYQGKNLIDLDRSTLERVRDNVLGRGFEVVAIASPLLKCPLPESPPSETGDAFFVVPRDYDSQADVLAKATKIARLFDTNLVRCFAFWRGAAAFEAVREVIAERMWPLVAAAQREGIVLGLENEFACYGATGAETRALIETVDSPALRAIWDPANAIVAGERAYPDGYEQVRGYVVDVHLKDAVPGAGAANPERSEWRAVGEGAVDYAGQLAALAADGYSGVASLEGHYTPAGGSKEDGIRRSLANVRRLLNELGHPSR